MPKRSGVTSSDSEQPLAQHFWIAGLDNQQLYDAYQLHRWSYDSHNNANGSLERSLGQAIPENAPVSKDASSIVESPKPSPGHARDSYKRLSKLSSEARNSILSLHGSSQSKSNRSSATIRAVPSPDVQFAAQTSTTDFDRVIQQFAESRESFFAELKLDSNAERELTRTKSRPRTQRIVAEELNAAPNRGLGSVRRHLSFRDMSSTKRQTTVARHVSTRTTKRISSYNSVISAPEAIRPISNQHPLKRKFEPVLLDRFPRSNMTTELKNRDPFPEYVPMFAFPNDINIIASDTRPRSTWHEFSLTAADNSKIPAVCVVIWLPMVRSVADELEKRCEEWRKANMTEAEREMAASLAERLALERAKLSRLLLQLPQASQDSIAREQLEDEIGAVEEKINVMSDMLKPLRHGAASKIDGLTDGETGFWIPRAYGIIGKDGTMAAFWRQWLRAVVVPMTSGAIVRVPASSPRVGIWQPLEQYVLTLCCDAPHPISSKTQINTTIRELHLYAKKHATNELPGSRTTDIYPFFRALTIPNIILLLEYVLAESRIILLSSHAAMLQLVSKTVIELIWPFEWTGVYIPVLPARLVQALDAPCPYICGILRDYASWEPPDDDFVIVDLDKNELRSTGPPPPLPKQQRRKLMSLLYLAAPHHHSCGVPPGPPAYTIETYPHDAFAVENDSVLSGIVKPTNLVKLTSLSSTSFGAAVAADDIRRSPIMNAFLAATPSRSKSIERPRTASTARLSTHPNSDQTSPITANFPALPTTPMSRIDSGYALQASLREKRSGHFDAQSKRAGSMSGIVKKASQPFMRHGASPSTISMSSDAVGLASNYAPSMYAQSTLAASTIMPGMMVQPAQNTVNVTWSEGHKLEKRHEDGRSNCTICDERTDDGHHRCAGCGMIVHARCANQITIVCSSAFYPDQVRAAFVRCFASLLYGYRKYLLPATMTQRRNGQIFTLDMDGFIKSQTGENFAYMDALRQTQAFSEFIAERERTMPEASDSIALFDAIVSAKRNRSGRFRSTIPGLGLRQSSRSKLAGNGGNILSDTTSHVWRIVNALNSTQRPQLGTAFKGRDYASVISRTPAKLEDALLERPDAVPQVPTLNAKAKKAILRERMNGLSMNAP